MLSMIIALLEGRENKRPLALDLLWTVSNLHYELIHLPAGQVLCLCRYNWRLDLISRPFTHLCGHIRLRHWDYQAQLFCSSDACLRPHSNTFIVGTTTRAGCKQEGMEVAARGSRCPSGHSSCSALTALPRNRPTISFHKVLQL